MSGILNNKERIFDFFITDEGRKQISNGTYDIKYVAFSDSHAFYQSDELSGSADPTERIYLEASNLPQDQITFEADDSGKLIPFGGSIVNVLGGKILSGTEAAFLDFVTGSNVFASLSDKLLSSSFENFTKLKTIGTIDFLDDTNNFIVSDNKVRFEINDQFPFKQEDISEISISSCLKFFQDPRLAKLPNFKYLPPKNKNIFKEETQTLLGDYSKLGQGEVLSYEQISNKLIDRERKTIDFTETSNQNNLHIQIFEGLSFELSKLDIIDYGELFVPNNDFPNKSVYFVGKIFIDEIGNRNFVNIFTIILE